MFPFLLFLQKICKSEIFHTQKTLMACEKCLTNGLFKVIAFQPFFERQYWLDKMRFAPQAVRMHFTGLMKISPKISPNGSTLNSNDSWISRMESFREQKGVMAYEKRFFFEKIYFFREKCQCPMAWKITCALWHGWSPVPYVSSQLKKGVICMTPHLNSENRKR